MFKTEVNIDIHNPSKGCKKILDLWINPEVKVIVTHINSKLNNVKSFYESLFPLLGRPAFLAEDGTDPSKRDDQRTGEIWMPIMYDPDVKDAYRHSKNPQPLHTDGSYIEGFPNSSFLCCVRNAAEGGETVFIHADDIMELLKSKKPELFEFFTNNIVPHARSGDRRMEKFLNLDTNPRLLNWNYYCIDTDFKEMNSKKIEELQTFLTSDNDVIANLVPVKLNHGEAVLWKDREVLHGRNGFSAVNKGDRFIWKCAFDVGNFE